MPLDGPVHPGQKLRIAADAWNRVLEATRAIQSQRLKGYSGSPQSDAVRASTTILIQNDSGSDLDAGATLAVGSAVLTVGVGFADEPCFHADLPATSGDLVCILAEPVASGAIGRAVVQGVAVATVSVGSTGDVYASPSVGGAFLTSGATGSVRIMSTPAGTGTQNVAVLISNAAPPDPGEGFIGVAARFVTTNPYTVTFSDPTDNQWVPVGDTADGTSLTFDTGDLYNVNQIWIPSDGYYLFNMEVTLRTSAPVPTAYAQDLILYEYSPTTFGDALLTASIPEDKDNWDVNVSVVRYMEEGKKFQLYAQAVSPMSFPYDLEIVNLRVSCVKLGGVGGGSGGSGGTTTGDGIGSYAGLARFWSY